MIERAKEFPGFDKIFLQGFQQKPAAQEKLRPQITKCFLFRIVDGLLNTASRWLEESVWGDAVKWWLKQDGLALSVFTMCCWYKAKPESCLEDRNFLDLWASALKLRGGAEENKEGFASLIDRINTDLVSGQRPRSELIDALMVESGWFLNFAKRACFLPYPTAEECLLSPSAMGIALVSLRRSFLDNLESQMPAIVGEDVWRQIREKFAIAEMPWGSQKELAKAIL